MGRRVLVYLSYFSFHFKSTASLKKPLPMILPYLGYLFTIVGTYKCPLALRSFMFFFLHFMPFLFHSSFLSFCGGPSFLLPPGQWKEGLDPTVTGFLQPWGLGRCIHPDHSQQQMEWPKGKQRGSWNHPFLYQASHFQPAFAFLTWSQRKCGIACQYHRTEITAQVLTYTPCLLRQGKPCFTFFTYKVGGQQHLPQRVFGWFQ